MHYDETDFLQQFNWQRQLAWGAAAFALHIAVIAIALHLRHSPPHIEEVMSVSLISEPPAPLPLAPAPAPKPVHQVSKPVKQVAPMPAPTPSPTTISTPQPPASTSNSTSNSTAAPSGSNSQTNEVAIVPPKFDAAYLNNPAPPYPSISRRLGEQGKVMLRVHVLANGSADRVDIKQSSGSSRLDEAAREAVSHWRFVPARQGADAVAEWVIVPVSFSLEK